MRPLTPDDLFAFRFITDAQLSPDAKRVAYVVKVADREKDGYRSAIWLVDVDGGEPRQLTSGEHEDGTPRWSPDGRSLAFTSDRGTVPEGRERAPRNLFLLDLAGGEPRRLTSLGDDVGDVAWSLDGARISFVAKPPRGEGDKEPKIRVYDVLRYRADEGGFSDLRRKHLWIVEVASGLTTQLTDGDWDDAQPAWSHDGTRIAFTSNRTPDRDRNTIQDVWVVPVGRLREPARLVTTSDGPNTAASWSPDDRTVAYFGHRDPRAGSAKNQHLWTRTEGAMEPRDLLAAWDGTVGSVVITDMRKLVALPAAWWSPEGATLYFIGSERGAANLYAVRSREERPLADSTETTSREERSSAAVPSAGGVPRKVTDGEHQVVTASFDRQRRRFAALIASATEPGDVYVGDVEGGPLRRLTNVNRELLDEVYVARAERIAFTGADGWEIEGWLLVPPGFDPLRPYPMVLQIHGGPHTAYGHSFFHEFQVLAGRGYVVLYTNPRGSHSYGERFVRAVVGDWGGKDYEDLMAGVDHLVARGFVDPARLGVTGGSYGGFMTNWVIGHTQRFAAAVTARSISNNMSSFGTSDIGWHFWEYEMGDATPYDDPQRYLRFSPITYAKDVTTPLLILHAENDYRCPIEQAEQMYIALKYLGKPARFVRYPKDTHDLTRGGKPSNRVHHMTSLVEWFDRYLMPERVEEPRREEVAAPAD